MAQHTNMPLQHPSERVSSMTEGPQFSFPLHRDTDMPLHISWDNALATFLHEAGLTQALRGLESDMLLLNEEWEKCRVNSAVQRLFVNLAVSFTDGQLSSYTPTSGTHENSLELYNVEHPC